MQAVWAHNLSMISMRYEKQALMANAYHIQPNYLHIVFSSFIFLHLGIYTIREIYPVTAGAYDHIISF